MSSHKVIIGNSRSMNEIEDESVHLVVTSPPYWSLKDYGTDSQIGYGQSLHQYLRDLFDVWNECFRVLTPGSRLCINVGDQFLRGDRSRGYRIIPIHAEIIQQCERVGYDYMGAIIWQKKTTMNTSGGANVMGSYPYPANGLLEIDYEFILIFRKPGKRQKVEKEYKESSKLSKDEWKEFFSGHWKFPGERQVNHEAMFPEELPRRILRMFSFRGDTVLDPFLGSGTTMRVCAALGRNSIGYEVNENFLELIRKKVMPVISEAKNHSTLEIFWQNKELQFKPNEYLPGIMDAIWKKGRSGDEEAPEMRRVNGVTEDARIILMDGSTIGFLGVEIDRDQLDRAIGYLNKYIRGKDIIIKGDADSHNIENSSLFYVYLRNRIFVNRELIKMGIGKVADYDFSKRENLLRFQR